MLDVKGRDFFTRLFRPIARVLIWARISATMVTLIGLALIVGGSVLIAAGEIQAGVLVIGAGAVVDAIDGIIARMTDTATKRGALLDTFSDRVGEISIWAGLAYFTADEPSLVALCVIALGNSLLIPFLRARAEAAGLPGKGGLMGRAERFILFGVGVGFTSLDWYPLTAFLWVAVALTGLTVAQRYYATWARLGE